MDELARKICEDLYEAFPAGMLLDGTGEEIVNTHLATLRALASSRAGDMATLLAENAALRAEVEAAANERNLLEDRLEYADKLYGKEICHIRDIYAIFRIDPHETPRLEALDIIVRAARLTRADGDG